MQDYGLYGEASFVQKSSFLIPFFSATAKICYGINFVVKDNAKLWYNKNTKFKNLLLAMSIIPNKNICERQDEIALHWP